MSTRQEIQGPKVRQPAGRRFLQCPNVQSIRAFPKLESASVLFLIPLAIRVDNPAQNRLSLLKANVPLGPAVCCIFCHGPRSVLTARR